MFDIIKHIVCKRYSLNCLYDKYGIKSVKYSDFSALIYYISFFLFFTLIYSQNFDLTGTIRPVLDIFRPVAIIFLLIFIKYVLFQSHSLGSLLLHSLIVAVVIGKAIYGVNVDIQVIMAVAFIICSENINYNTFFRLFFFFFTFWIVYATIVGLILGSYITEIYEYRGRTTYRVLDYNSNTMGLYLFIIFALFLICFDQIKYKWIRYILGSAFVLYDYYIVNCLTSIAGIILLSIAFEVLYSNVISQKTKKILIYIGLLGSSMLVFLFFIIPYAIDIYSLFPMNGTIWKITSNRLHSGASALTVYSPWTMWGQTFDKELVYKLTSNAYHDSFLLAHLIDDGIFATSLLCLGLVSLIYKLIRDKNYDMLCIIMVFFIYSAYERNVLYLWNTPIWYMILPIWQQTSTMNVMTIS